jgi:hypothetical protein
VVGLLGLIVVSEGETNNAYDTVEVNKKRKE